MEKNAARLICVAGSGFPAPGGVAKPRCGTNCIVLSWSLSKIAHLKAASLVCIASSPVAIAAADLPAPVFTTQQSYGIRKWDPSWA